MLRFFISWVVFPHRHILLCQFISLKLRSFLFPHTNARPILSRFLSIHFPNVSLSYCSSAFRNTVLRQPILYSHTHNAIPEFCYLYTECRSKQWLTPTGTWLTPPSEGREWDWFCECRGRCLRFIVVYVLVFAGKCWVYAEAHHRRLTSCSTHKSKFEK
jgi:hypothetical protein